MTKEEAFNILDGAEIMVFNRNFENFKKAFMIALISLQNEIAKINSEEE